MTAEEMLDEIQEKVEIIYDKLKNKTEGKPRIIEKKNSHLHLLLETSLMNKIEKEAKDRGMNISALVRQRLRDNNQLDRIERKVDKLIQDENHQI